MESLTVAEGNNGNLEPIEPFRCPHCHQLIPAQPAWSHRSRFRLRTMAQVRVDLGIRLPWFEKIAEVHPAGRMGVKSAMEAFERIVTADEAGHKLAQDIYRGAVRYRKRVDANPTIKVKWMEGWLLKERWRDGTIRPVEDDHADAPVQPLP